jgi:hypothetical protein
MRLSYKPITFTEYRAAVLMFRKKNLFLRYDQVLWTVLAIACVIAYGLVHLHGPNGTIETIFYYSVCLAIGLPLLRNLNMILGFRALRKNRKELAENITEIDENRISDITPGTCELIYEWKSVTGIGQNGKITVICTTGSQFLFFPTSAFSSEQLTEFNSIASSYNVRRWSC